MLLSRVSQMALKLTGRGNALVQTMHNARLAMPQGVQALPSVAGGRALSVRAGTLCLCRTLLAHLHVVTRFCTTDFASACCYFFAATRASESGSSVNGSAIARLLHFHR